MCAILGYDGRGPNLPGVASRDVESRANIACCEHAVVVFALAARRRRATSECDAAAVRGQRP